MKEKYIDLTEIKNSEEICYDYFEGYEPPEDGREWEKLETNLWLSIRPVTNAIISASFDVGLDRINEANLLEWLYRTNCLFDVGKYFLFIETEEGEVPLRLRACDFKSHLNFYCDSKVVGKRDFDLSLRSIRIKNILKLDPNNF